MTENEETVRYTADVVCIRGNEVLLIERVGAPYQGWHALPGGHVDAGENSRDAGARELLEQTGIRVDPAALTLVGIYDAPDRDPRSRYISAAYMVVVPPDVTAQAGDDAAEVWWVPLNAPGNRLAFDHAEILGDAWRRTITH